MLKCFSEEAINAGCNAAFVTNIIRDLINQLPLPSERYSTTTVGPTTTETTTKKFLNRIPERDDEYNPCPPNLMYLGNGCYEFIWLTEPGFTLFPTSPTTSTTTETPTTTDSLRDTWRYRQRNFKHGAVRMDPSMM